MLISMSEDRAEALEECVRAMSDGARRRLVEIPAADDVVNHPTHYTSDPSGVECIQITRHRNFDIGNAIKYLWRAGLKDDPGQTAFEKQVEDLRKAVFYIEDEIERLHALAAEGE